MLEGLKPEERKESGEEEYERMQKEYLLKAPLAPRPGKRKRRKRVGPLVLWTFAVHTFKQSEIYDLLKFLGIEKPDTYENLAISALSKIEKEFGYRNIGIATFGAIDLEKGGEIIFLHIIKKPEGKEMPIYDEESFKQEPLPQDECFFIFISSEYSIEKLAKEAFYFGDKERIGDFRIITTGSIKLYPNQGRAVIILDYPVPKEYKAFVFSPDYQELIRLNLNYNLVAQGMAHLVIGEGGEEDRFEGKIITTIEINPPP